VPPIPPLAPRCIRIAVAVLALVATALLAPSAHGAPRTETRTFKAIGSQERSLSFRLVGVEPAAVRRARLISGRRSAVVPLPAARSGARRGVLRLPLSALGADGRGRRDRRTAPRAKLVLTVGASHGHPAAPQDGDGTGLAGVRLHVEAYSSARLQADAWRSSRPLDAAHMDGIAGEAQAKWFGEWSGDVRAAVSELMNGAATRGEVAVLVAYNIPQRDCGSHSAGGAASTSAYRNWIREFARGIGNRQAMVVLEPDALAGLDCLSGPGRANRLALLEDAVSVLAAHGSVATYVDAGHSAWQSADVMAARLNSVGISRARGFSLNVSNFRPTGEETAYGRAIAERTGGRRFVIDTSRNGLATASQEWCNPAGRALGRRPTTNTGQPFVDAYLWIKRPGESDGTCNGGPPAGAWWPEYALGLAQRAT
jgi:endoglucanase